MVELTEIVVHEVVDNDGKVKCVWQQLKDDYVLVSFKLEHDLYYYIVGHINRQDNDIFYLKFTHDTHEYQVLFGPRSDDPELGVLWIDNITVRISEPNWSKSDDPDPCIYYSVRGNRLALNGTDLDLFSNREICQLLKSRKVLMSYLHELNKGGAPKGNTNTKILKSEEEKAGIISEWDQVRHKSRKERDRYSEKVGISIRTLQRWFSESSK